MRKTDVVRGCESDIRLSLDQIDRGLENLQGVRVILRRRIVHDNDFKIDTRCQSVDALQALAEIFRRVPVHNYDGEFDHLGYFKESYRAVFSVARLMLIILPHGFSADQTP